MSLIQQIAPAFTIQHIAHELADLLTSNLTDESLDEGDLPFLTDELVCNVYDDLAGLYMDYYYEDFLRDEFFLPVCEELVEEW